MRALLLAALSFPALVRCLSFVPGANLRTAVGSSTRDEAAQGSASQGSAARDALVAQGSKWAAHILEGPRSWLLSLLYILLTVVSGYTPLSLTVQGIVFAATGNWGWGSAKESWTAHTDPLKYAVGLVDAIVYAFLPWWTTVLLRLAQGRPWHHRVSGRALLIGDVPWVAQVIAHVQPFLLHSSPLHLTLMHCS